MKVTDVIRMIKGGIKVSIKGGSGIGKTYVLKKISRMIDGIYMNRLSPRKERIIKLIQLLRKKKVCISKSTRILNRMKIDDLIEYVKSLKINDDGIILLLDDVDKYTPREMELFDVLYEKFNVVFAFENMKKISKYVYRTKVVTLKPLTRKRMERILDEYNINDPSIRMSIMEKSAGIPGVFFSMLKNPSAIHTVSSHPPKKIDMTWILLVFFSFIIMMRFIALGTNDVDKYILAGLLYASFFTFRPFIYKGMRKE